MTEFNQDWKIPNYLKPFCYPPVLEINNAHLVDAILLDSDLLNNVQSHPRLLTGAEKVVPRSLRLLHNQIFQNNISHLWDSLFLLSQYPNLVTQATKKFSDEKENHDTSIAALKRQIEAQTGGVDREIQRELAKLEAEAKRNNARNQKRVEDLEKDLEYVRGNTFNVVIAMQIIDLAKGWLAIEESYLSVSPEEYIALRYLPINLIRVLKKGEETFQVLDVDEARDEKISEHWIRDTAMPYSQQYIKTTYELLSYSWRYTGFHNQIELPEMKSESKLEAKSESKLELKLELESPTAPSLGIPNESSGSRTQEISTEVNQQQAGLVYPMWNFGDMILHICRETDCVTPL